MHRTVCVFTLKSMSAFYSQPSSQHQKCKCKCCAPLPSCGDKYTLLPGWTLLSAVQFVVLMLCDMVLGSNPRPGSSCVEFRYSVGFSLGILGFSHSPKTFKLIGYSKLSLGVQIKWLCLKQYMQWMDFIKFFRTCLEWDQDQNLGMAGKPQLTKK